MILYKGRVVGNLKQEPSLFFFSLMVTGFKRPLTESDLWELQSTHRVEKLQQRFEKYWNIELAKKEKYASSFVRISFTFDNPHSFKLKEQYIFHFRIW